MDFDAEDVEELDAALVGVSWSDIHLLKCNPSVERRVSTNPSGRAAMGMKRTAITPFPVAAGGRCGKVLQQDRDRPAIRLIFGDGAAAIVIGPAPEGSPPDIEAQAPPTGESVEVPEPVDMPAGAETEAVAFA
jgi:hypothetical protein